MNNSHKALIMFQTIHNETVRLHKGVNALHTLYLCTCSRESKFYAFATNLALCARACGAALSEFGLHQLRRLWDSPNDKATIMLWYRITYVLFLFTIFPFYRDLHVTTTALFMAAAAPRTSRILYGKILFRIARARGYE